MEKVNLPQEVKTILAKLNRKGFEAFVVGGSVRDLLLDKSPTDWDVTTNARPKQIQKIFARSFYENDFGTVTVVFDKPSQPSVKTIEVTTYRTDGVYKDFRRPEKINYTASLEKDLARRDFTINTITLDSKGNFIDPYKGQEDLENKLVRTVGTSSDRFSEDALRMVRAIRFATQLKFNIENETFEGIKLNHNKLKKIAVERVRDEFNKIIMSGMPELGIFLLEKSLLLNHIIPELHEGIGISQNKSHVFTVYDHLLRSLSVAAQRKFPLEVRLAALLHDVAKPRTKEGEGYEASFHNHEIKGGKMVLKILTRLKYPKKNIEKTVRLVKNHMFYYEMGRTTDSAIRRMVRRIGPENLKDQINLRIADRLGMGRPKAVPYRLKKLIERFEEVQKDPINVQMLKINGDDLIKKIRLAPGPKMGLILNALLEEVLKDPGLNKKEKLRALAEKFNKMPEVDLRKKSPNIQEYERRRRQDKKYEKELGLK